jgi:uncharacterized membrane protein YhhN
MAATAATLSAVAWMLGAGHIWSGYIAHRSKLAFWLKPLPILLFILIAALAEPPISATYRALIIAGLIFSAAGDIFLALPQDRFVWGLGSFLVAHLFYVAAFVSVGGFGFTWWIVLAALLYGAAMLAVLWPSVGTRLRLPVAVYLAVILIMGWQAAERWAAVDSPSARLALIGAALFIISDSVLALNKFRGGFPGGHRAARIVTMLTYYSAQWLLALSVQA